jgi:hypothetical protein
MRSRRIPDSDSLFRQTIHPLSFKGAKFAHDRLLRLKYDQADRSLLASLTWERYVPTAKLIHGYGCRLALYMNETERRAGTLKEKNRRIYCGAYELKGHAIRALAGTEGLDEILSADVVQLVEKGEIAHVNLRIILRPSEGLDVAGTKTAILDRLWNICSGPLTHICDCDQHVPNHPSSDLVIPPAGPYLDTRPRLLRLWCIVRFHICSWLWQHFLQPGD